jgi:hypothetical protein
MSHLTVLWTMVAHSSSSLWGRARSPRVTPAGRARVMAGLSLALGAQPRFVRRGSLTDQQQGERKPGHRRTFPFIDGIAEFLYMGEPTTGRDDRGKCNRPLSSETRTFRLKTLTGEQSEQPRRCEAIDSKLVGLAC